MFTAPVSRRGFCSAAALAGLGATPFAQAAEPAEPAETKPILVHTPELAGRPPDGQATGSRLWTLHKTAQSRTNLVEMRGEVGLHKHPDAAHSLYVIRGEVEVVAGDLKTTLQPGDYISIPAGVPHRYKTPIDAPALLLSMDAPPYDPAKTVRL
jgi:quercetin dioxygenase-like cupin family protein